MKLFLYLAFIVGLSTAAYAIISPPVNFPITITAPVGGNTACASPAVPHPAQVAGFTTLADCWDFTTNSGTNNVYLGAAQNQNWSPMSWLDCNNGIGTGNQPGKQWSWSNGGQPTTSCNAASIGTDPATSTQALIFTVTPAMGGGNGLIAGMATTLSYCGRDSYVCYMSFPTGNVYAEIKWRYD